MVFLTLIFPFSVSADYYRYVDEKGVPRYVDSMMKVPKAYHNQVVFHVLPTGNVNVTVGQKSMGDLTNKKMELDEEYTALMKEKEELLKSIREWEKKYRAWENKKTALGKMQ
jgi:hypothetical protein